MQQRLKNSWPYWCALVLGMLLTASFAPYAIFPFAILALAGLLALWLVVTTPRKSFWLGFLFGVGLFGTGVNWVFHSIHIYGGVTTPLAVLITSLMVAILALYPAYVGYFLNRYFSQNNTTKILYAFPAIWLFSEWLRCWLFTGFPWLLVGYSQTNSPLKGYAPLLSVYGVSLAVIISSSLIVHAVLSYRAKQYQKLYTHLLTIVLIWIAGFLLTLIPWSTPIGAPLKVALVQGNIPQALKWSPQSLQLSINRYIKLTDPLWGKNQLIIWPESAIPLPLPYAQDLINNLNAKALETDTTLILGIPIQSQSLTGFFNAVVTLGQEQKVYLKRRLVPFGEYTPLISIFSRAFSFMHIPMSNMLPGKISQPPLNIGNHINILTAICYEIAFPELVRVSDSNVSFLLTVTDDTWFGKSSAQAQHLQMAAMRAIEFKRPLLMASNDGITAIIDVNGNITTAAPPYQTYVLTGSIQPMRGMTPWMFNGADPVLFIALCLLFIAIRNKRRSSQSDKSK